MRIKIAVATIALAIFAIGASAQTTTTGTVNTTCQDLGSGMTSCNGTVHTQTVTAPDNAANYQAAGTALGQLIGRGIYAARMRHASKVNWKKHCQAQGMKADGASCVVK